MGWSETRSMFGGVSAYVDADSNGGNDIEIVAAETGKQIVVDRVVVSVSAAASIFFESGTSTVIIPTMYLAAGATIDLDDLNFRTTAGAALTASATITGNISILVFYHKI